MSIARKTLGAKTDNYSGSYYDSPSDFEVIERVQQVAKQKGIPVVDLCPGLDDEQARDNRPPRRGDQDAVAALSVKLSEDEIKQLEELYQPHRVIGFDE